MKAGYNIGIIRTNKTTSIVLGTEYQMMEEFMEQFEIESGQDVISNIQELKDAKVTYKLITMSLIGFLHGTSSTLFNTTDLYQTTQFNLNEDLGDISLREYVYSWENGDLNELKKKLWAYQEKQGFTDDPLKDKSDEYLKSMDNAVAEANEVARLEDENDGVYVNGKAISEVSETADGKLMVEWEYEDGGRFREVFETEKDREKALEPYRTTNLLDSLIDTDTETHQVAKVKHNHIVRHNIQSLQDIQKFMYAGNSTFTIQNTETMNRFTYKFSKPKTDMDGTKINNKDSKVWFVKVMTGTDNESSYSFVGTVFVNNNGVKFYKHSLKSRITTEAQSVKVINWFVDKVEKNSLPKQIQFWHEGTCGRCGRKLTVPESIENGIGPECIKMM